MTDRQPEDLVTDVLSAPGQGDARRDRREHAGVGQRYDDDALVERVQRERAELESRRADYDPADVPPATDVDLPVDLTETDAYQAELTEVRRQARAGELATDQHDMPPTSYRQS